MGENEQGGMLRVVVVLGLIAIVATVVIFAVTGLKNTSKTSIKDTVQRTDLARYDRDLGSSLKSDRGMLTSINGNSSVITNASIAMLRYEPNVLSKIDTSYKTTVFTGGGDVDSGIFWELFPNQDTLDWLKSDSNSEYVYISVDYKIKNGVAIDYAAAKSLKLDTARDDTRSGIVVGARSNSYVWNYKTAETPTGDKTGTIVTKAPKSIVGATYEFYVAVMNMNYDSLEIDNIHISNANVFG